MSELASSKDFAKYSNSLYVGGAFARARSEDFFPVVDPATEEVLATIADASDEDIDQAIDVANEAQRVWNRIDMRTRATMLHDIAAGIRQRPEAYAEVMTREMGKPYKEARDEVSWCGTAIDYYAEIARHDVGRVVGTTVPGQFHYSVREPLGVVVIILPFNYPLCLLCWEAAAALAAGNAVIIKPHEQTSVTTLKFMEFFASLPEGVIQVVTGTGKVGARLVESRKTHGVAYTGSVPIGQIVAKSCAEQFKPCLIEASGNDPFIVMPSAPIDLVARAAAFGANMNCGQICTSSDRFFIHEQVHDEFVEKLVREVAKLRIGNGLSNVDLGPLATKRQLERFEQLVERAKGEGAKVEIGGSRTAGQNTGWFYDPTVLTNIQPGMELLREEAFGPLASICKVRDFDQAIALANDSDFGLGATVYTLDSTETFRAVEEIESGIVWVNAPLLDNDALPFGGRKMTGVGRQLGPEGLHQFQRSKMVLIDPKASDQSFWWFPYADAEAFPR